MLYNSIKQASSEQTTQIISKMEIAITLKNLFGVVLKSFTMVETCDLILWGCDSSTLRILSRFQSYWLIGHMCNTVPIGESYNQSSDRQPLRTNRLLYWAYNISTNAALECVHLYLNGIGIGKVLKTFKYLHN